nr:synaptobrevin, longin-like domain protein [Tanacetum cinerariifolium]
MPCEALSMEISSSILLFSLLDAELFENLQLIGYNILPNQKFTFQKGQFSHQWKYLIHTIMQCLSPKSTGFSEFRSNIATALVCLATNRVYNFSKMIFVGMGEGSGIPTESHHTPTSEASQSSQHQLSSPSLPPVPTESLPTVILSYNPPLRQYTRRTRISHSLVLPPVADEPAFPLGDVSQGEACLTDSGFEADQDRANIAKTSTFPSDSTPRVTSLAADEGSMQQKLNELTALCTILQRQHSEMVSRFAAQELEINSLKARIKLLEDKDRGVAEQSGDDAPIKGRRLDKGEKAAERVSDYTKEMATVLTSMDATSILTSGGVQVLPTAAEVATATMVESDTPKKKKLQEHIDVLVARELEEQMAREYQRMSEQIARDTEEYEQIPEDLSIRERIELISDMVKYQETYAQVLKYQTLQRKPRSKKQKKDYYMAVIKGHAGWKTKDFKGMSFEQIEAKFNTVWKQIEDFIPMGSKEEAERLKRKGLRLEHKSAKKLKTSEEVPEEVKSYEEVPEEKVKEMMQLVVDPNQRNIKCSRLDEGEEVAERVNDDTKEMANVLTSMYAASILTGGGVQMVLTAAEVATATVSVPTGSGMVSTASPIIPIAALIFINATESTPYTRRKGKEKMAESDTPKKKKLQEQIDVQVARELEEQMAREDQRMSKHIARDAEVIPEDISIGERIDLISDLIEDFIPMGSKEGAERLKRKGLRLEQESTKKLKTSEEVPQEEGAERLKRKGLRLEQESPKKLKTSKEVPQEVKSTEEVLEEKVKEMMQLVLVEEVFVEALQVKHPIIDWKVHKDREVIRRSQVKETLSIRPATSDKEKELWVKLKRMFELDVEDYIWTHTQNQMHAPVEWKLYDTCGVHHVSTKDQYIFMLIEKDYPLRKGLAIVMICYKLQVENYSQMANDLILKIHKNANRPRQQND